MNNTDYGNQPIKNEQSGYHYTEPNRDSVDLQRILTAAKGLAEVVKQHPTNK